MSIKSKTQNNLGLTLLELVVTVALFAILTLVITKLYIQVLSAQDRILDEQNLVADLNYATSVFMDESRRASMQMAPFPCTGALPSCQNKFFCSAPGDVTACMVSAGVNPVNYYNDQGIFKVMRVTPIYAITSSDITINSMKLQADTDGQQLRIQFKASGNNQYGQSIYYQNYITK